jgi:hypothetical protein
MSTKKQREADESRAYLLDTLKLQPGETVSCVLRHVSRSGMMRAIDFYVVREGSTWRITYHVARVLGWTLHKATDALRVDGCGMDMGFHTVYNLGRMLWPNGTEKPHGTRNGQPDTDGGYALKQRWI